MENTNTKNPIRKFTQLIAWQEAHALVLLIYKITTKFPLEERYGITNQIRRAVIPITSNIAEGFVRSTAKDKHHFYTTSKASLSELENQLIASRDLQFIPEKNFLEIENQIIIVDKLIAGLCKSVKDHIHS